MWKVPALRSSKVQRRVCQQLPDIPSYARHLSLLLGLRNVKGRRTRSSVCLKRADSALEGTLRFHQPITPFRLQGLAPAMRHRVASFSTLLGRCQAPRSAGCSVPRDQVAEAPTRGFLERHGPGVNAARDLLAELAPHDGEPVTRLAASCLSLRPHGRFLSVFRDRESLSAASAWSRVRNRSPWPISRRPMRESMSANQATGSIPIRR
jgi:hypothetical protein